ncbi:MAG TPA: hypothetical protein VF761_01865 [Gemmatimonadaceae bacterium]
MKHPLVALSGFFALLAATTVSPRVTQAQSTSSGPPDVSATWQKGATIVICRDGTSSTAGNDACALHGGIKSYPGARGPVNAALKMEDHASKWEKTLPPPSRGGGTPKVDSTAAKPDSTAKRKPR